MKNLIIFDFDGVLVDSLDFWFVINKSAAALVGKRLTKQKYLQSFLGNIHSGLRDGLKLNAKEAVEFSKQKIKLIKMAYNPNDVKFFSFAPELIRQLSKKYDLCIVTSSPEPAVRSLLKGKRLENNFKKIYGLNKFGKRHILKVLLKKYLSKKVLFVTDTIGDVKEGKAVGVFTVAVGWGFHKPKELKTAKPDEIILKPNQFRRIF